MGLIVCATSHKYGGLLHVPSTYFLSNSAAAE